MFGGHIGFPYDPAELVSTNDDRHVTAFRCDISAAANISTRADPWGERLPWKLAGDDSPLDRRSGDRAQTTVSRARDPHR